MIVAGFNLMGVDAMTLGEKDLTVGLDTLRERIEQAGFAVLSANVRRADNGERVAEPYAFVDRGGHRIAVIGLTREILEPPEGFDVGDPLAALQAVMPDVLAETAAVFVLTNMPFELAQELARAVPDIDLVVAANPEYVPDHAIPVPGTAALAVTAERPSDRHTGRRVGRLAVTLGVDGTLSDPEWSTRSLDAALADDPEMGELLARYEIQ